VAIQVPTMGKDKNKAPDFKVSIPYIPEVNKEVDQSDGKPPSVKLLLDAKGEAIDNPTIHVQPIFSGGTTKQCFKWYNSLSSLMEGQLVGENYRLAPQALRGTYKALWQQELDLASPKLAVAAGISNDTVEKLCCDTIMKLTKHVLKDPR
jgi:hypothetical protein